MQNVTVYYQAELDYRREQVRRDFRPLSSRKARAAARNQVNRAEASATDIAC